MHRLSFPTLILITCCCIQVRAAENDRPWWRYPQRLLQTNLREIDAAMDVERYLREVEASGASVVLFNVGGIVANYPTDLPFHYRNPHMTGDLAGTVLKRLHERGLRMIGRFDFSKLNERIAAEHPDWLYVSEKGAHVNYNGQVHTCFNGPYQQEKLFAILGEALDRYPLDGIFFNMPGYQQRDYSGNYHGICQSAACRKRFKQWCGMDLPAKNDPNNPAWKKYRAFCRATADELYGKIRQFVKSKRPDLVILNYKVNGSTVIRSESNRPYPSWAYRDTDKALYRHLRHPDKPLSNAAVHFIHYPQRHAGVSCNVTRRRLLQHMVRGQWIDFYCIGPLQRLEDRFSVDVVRDVFGFHARNEKYFRTIRPCADVALVRTGTEEYRGLFEILSENHVTFDLVDFGDNAFAGFSALIVPDAGRLAAAACRRLDAWVQGGGLLLLTGAAPKHLQAAGISGPGKTLDCNPGTYIRIRKEDRNVLGQPALEKLDLVYLDGEFVTYDLAPSARGLLRYIPAAMFGPPEKCYYETVSDMPCLIVNRHGTGACAVFPWQIGTHYAKQKHPGHALLAAGALEGALGLRRAVEVDASPLVEICRQVDTEDRFEWVSLLNLSGQKDAAGFFDPVPMRDIAVRIRPRRPVASVRLLKAGRELPFDRRADGRIACTVPELRHYEIVLLAYR